MFGDRGIKKDGNGFIKMEEKRWIRRRFVKKGMKEVRGKIRMEIMNLEMRKIILRKNIIGDELGWFIEKIIGIGSKSEEGRRSKRIEK